MSESSPRISPAGFVANEGSLTVALDIELTDALRREGLAREIINRVQNIRKDRGYEITDTVTLVFAPKKKSKRPLNPSAIILPHRCLPAP